MWYYDYSFFFVTMVNWHWNHIRKKSHVYEGWPFIGRFKVGSLLRMINIEVLAQCIYKPT